MLINIDNMTSRIVRLMSQDTLDIARFTNIFNEPIMLKPNTQIALINLAVTLDTRNIVVTNDNNKLEFQCKNLGDVYQATLTVGVYNLDEFEKEINIQMNKVLTRLGQGQDSAGDPMSFQWKATFVDDILHLNFGLGAMEDATFDDLYQMTGVSDKEYYASAGVTNWRAHAVSKDYFCKGTGEYGCFLKKNGTANSANSCIGLLREKPSGDAIAPQNYDYCIWSDKAGAGSTYKIIYGDTTYNTGVAIGDAKQVDIMLDGGKLKFFIAGTLVRTVDTFDNTIDYYLGLSGKQANDGAYEIQYQRDPFKKKDPLSKQVNDHVNLFVYGAEESLLGATPIARNVTLILPDMTRDLLGFNYVAKLISAVQGYFKSTYPMNHTSIPSSLLVLLDSFSYIESHDGHTSEKQAIISVIPSILLQENNKLVYEPPFPVYLTLNNAYDIPLTSLSVRIIESLQGKELAIENPPITITLLIRDSHK